MAAKQWRRHGRRKPYTEIGIKRLPCFRCGHKPAVYQWQVCADGNLYHPVCAECDKELNVMVLRWMKHPHANKLLKDYKP